MRLAPFLLLPTAAACGSHAASPDARGDFRTDAGPDAPDDAPPADATPPTDALPDGAPDAIRYDAPLYPRMPWGTPTEVAVPNGFNVGTEHPSLTANQLTLFVHGIFNGEPHIWLYTRASTSDSFTFGRQLSELESTGSPGALDPVISLDGLTLDFVGSSPLEATRATVNDPFVVVGHPSFGLAFAEPNITPDGTMAVMSGYAPGRFDYDVFMATRPDRSSPWSTPAIVDSTSTAMYNEHAPMLSADGLELYFSRAYKILVATRPSTSVPFGQPQAADELNQVGLAEDTWISPDGHTIYFVATATANQNYKLYTATR